MPSKDTKTAGRRQRESGIELTPASRATQADFLFALDDDSAWWFRDDKLQCGNCTLSDLADAGIITKGQPYAQGWAGYNQRRREGQQGSVP